MRLYILTLVLSVLIISVDAILPRQPPLPNEPPLLGNTSVLPAGWTTVTPINCLADCGGDDFLLGPSFSDPVGLTIESCVAFCDQQGNRIAGLKGALCQCSNIFNPLCGFESDAGECTLAGFADTCPGNPLESCGVSNGSPPLFILFQNAASQFGCSNPVWPGGAALTAGDEGEWRFSYFYNDSITARALGKNSVNLKVPVPRGNMTTDICTTACGNAGFTLAGVEFADECYCGNTIENNAQPITNCNILPMNGVIDTVLKRCTGNPKEFCGGSNIVSIYTLPGTGLIPLIPFGPNLNDFCSGEDCPGNE